MAELGNMFVRLGLRDREFNRGIVKVKRDLKTTGTSIDKVDRQTKSWIKSWKGMALVGTAAIGGIIYGLKRLTTEFVSLANVQEAVETRLAAVIRSTGQAAGFNIEQMKKMASAYQEVTTVGDEVILGGQAILATFKTIRGEGFERTTMAALDMSEVMQTDLKSSIVMIGKAMNDPIANLSAMTRAGVQFTVTQKDMIKELWAAGKTMEAQNIILTELESQFGGAAKAARDVFGGAIKAAGNALGDTKEELGFTITKSEFFIDLAKEAEETFKLWTQVIRDNREELQALAKTIVGTTVALAGWMATLAGIKTLTKAQAEAAHKLHRAWINYNTALKRSATLGYDNTKTIEKYKKRIDELSIAMGRQPIFYEETADAAEEVATAQNEVNQAIQDASKYLKELKERNEAATKSNKAFAASALEEWEALKKVQSMEEEILRLRWFRAAIVGFEVPTGISKEEWDKAFGAGEDAAKESINAIEEAYKTFLERTQGAFADTFYDIFKEQWEGWQGLMDKMMDLLARTLAEMVAKAAMTTIKAKFATEAIGGAAGAAGAGLAGGLVAGGILYGYQQAQEESSQRRRWKEFRKAISEIESEIRDLLNPLNTMEQAFADLNKRFDDYIERIKATSTNLNYIAHLENLRATALQRLRTELQEAFAEPLWDMIAQATMGPTEYERHQLEQWYSQQIVLAKTLGQTSVDLLTEAYNLAQKQLVLAQQEALLGLAAGYEDIIATMGMAAIESALYYIEKAHAAAAETPEWAAALTDIDLLNAKIKTFGEYVSATAAVEPWIAPSPLSPQFRSWEDFLSEAGIKITGLELEGIPPEFHAWHDAVLDLAEYFPEVQAALDRLATDGYNYTMDYIAVLGNIEQYLTDAQGALIPLEDVLGELESTELEAYIAQVKALRKSVTEDWAAIIRKFTMTEQELALFALEEWYKEQLAAAAVLGLALDDLNYAYQLQKDAIMETADAVEELTTALDQTIKSIDDMIMQLTGGALAPVQSAAFYQAQYAGLLGGAQTAQGAEAIAEAVQDLNAFIPTYLDFMKSYGMDYAALTASIVADLQALREGILPTAQFGGLTTGPTIAGEHGPELITPMYEPEYSSFMQSIGLSGEQEIHVHVQIDGREIGNVTTKQLQSNTDLVRQVENIARRVMH